LGWLIGCTLLIVSLLHDLSALNGDGNRHRHVHQSGTDLYPLPAL
jgi:hypothetical protein